VKEKCKSSLRAISLLGWPLLFLLLGCWPAKKETALIEPLPVIASVPEFLFSNQNDEEFGLRNVQGRVFMANFIFTRCPSVCPVMLDKTAKLMEEIKDYGISVVFLTFTVDPEHDTSLVLRRKAEELKANHERWFFLTHTNKEEMMKLFKDGFKVGVSEPIIAQDLFDIAHSEKIVLVDKRSRIRGFYSYEEESLQQLKRDIQQLHQESM
jgi:protein SCO1